MSSAIRQVVDMMRVAGLRSVIGFERARRWGWNGMLKGYFLARVIQTALDLGLLDAMRTTPIDPEAFAVARGLEPRLVAAVCEYLYVRRVLDRRDGRYTLDRDGRFLVDNDLMRGWLMLSHGYEGVLHELDQLMRGDTRYGDAVVRDGRLVAEGSGLVGACVHIPLLAEMLGNLGSRTVLDVGCGDGAFLRHLCRVRPDVRGVGIDLCANAVEQGRRTIAEEGLSDRVTLHVGDALDLPAMPHVVDGVDAVTSFFVLHELCDAGNNDRLRVFLAAIRLALPDAALLVVETIRPAAEELRRRPGPAVEYYLFHDLSGQVPLGIDAWRRELDAAQFDVEREVDLSFTRSAIFVTRPRALTVPSPGVERTVAAGAGLE